MYALLSSDYMHYHWRNCVVTWQAQMVFTKIHTLESLLKLLIKIYGYDTNILVFLAKVMTLTPLIRVH
jgi:hypothetical protein